MDQQIRRRELVEKYRQSDKTVKPRPASNKPMRTWTPIETEQAKLEHAEAIKRGIIPF